MTVESADSRPETEAQTGGLLARCPRCSMQVRRTEMDIHLAHSHNIGPSAKSDKARDGRRRRRPDNDE